MDDTKLGTVRSPQTFRVRTTAEAEALFTSIGDAISTDEFGSSLRVNPVSAPEEKNYQLRTSPKHHCKADAEGANSQSY